MRGWYRRAVVTVGLLCIVFLGVKYQDAKKMNVFHKQQIQLVALSQAEELNFSQISTIYQAEKAEEYPLCFTAWQEKQQETVYAFDGLRRTKTTAIHIYGSSEYLISCGRILQKDDTQGCLLGEKTAERLFGERNVRGLVVLYQGRELVIRDVLKAPADVILFQEQDRDAAFSRMTIWENDSNRKNEVEVFCGRYGIKMRLLADEWSLGVEELLELVPGKWSDFEGWKQNIKEWKSQKEDEERIQKSILDKITLNKYWQFVVYYTCTLTVYHV